MIEAVLLDWGGTLCHYVGAVRLFQDAAARIGRPLGFEEAVRLVDRLGEVRSLPDVIAAERVRDLSVEESRLANMVSLRAIGLDEGFAQAICDREDEADAYTPFPDTRDFLLELRRLGMRTAVVSNCGVDIRANFRCHDLDHFIDAYVLSCEHGITKPDPRLFEIALCELEVAADAALMVGDAPPDAGAVKVGIRVILLPPSGPSRQRRDRDLGEGEISSRGFDFVLAAFATARG